MSGRKVHFRVLPVADVDSSPVTTNDEVYPSFLGPDGPGPGASANFQASGWTTIDIVFPNDGHTYTDMGIFVHIIKDGPTTGRWGATFYIDDVSLLP
jgi:hypothetical protein